jgi:spore maturation protein CgeB
MILSPERKVLYHPYGRGLCPALEAELENLGLLFRSLDEVPADHPLDDGIACIIWFYFALRSPIETWRLKRRLQKSSVPLMAWNRDAPHYLNRQPWRLDLLDKAKILDIYASHSLIDSRRYADNVLYLANAADTNIYHLETPVEANLIQLRDTNNFRYDVSFFGGMNGSRHKEDADRERFFLDLSKRLQVRGISFLFREAEDMSIAEQTALIQTSRINLNYGARCEYQVAVASGLPERCFGIPACGGFLLCDKRTHARDDFTIGGNWAEFDGIDDCVAKTEYWLNHFDHARDLAERCYHHVMANHTYRNRAINFHETLLTWHAKKNGSML